MSDNVQTRENEFIISSWNNKPVFLPSLRITTNFVVDRHVRLYILMARVQLIYSYGRTLVILHRARILVQVTIYRRLLIGRDGHLDQSEAYDIS